MASPESLTRQLASPDCPHSSPRQVTLFPARDYITGDVFRIERCPDCGLVRTIPQPKAGDLVRYYPPGYYGRGVRYPLFLQRFLDGIYTRRARHLEQRCSGRHGKALDIGCGPGWMLDKLRARGWEGIGTERDDESARFARSELGLEVLTGENVLEDLPSNSFDLVILWHVLEHLAEPAREIAEISRLLRPGGIALLAVPNFGSIEARLAGPRWFHLDVPRHLSHIELPTLRSLLDRSGLEIMSAGYFSPEYDVFSAVQTSLNMLGLRQNMLYNLLRSRGSRLMSAGELRRHPVSALLTMALTPLIGALSLLWVPSVALTRQGATLTVHARKREVSFDAPRPAVREVTMPHNIS